MRTFVDDKLVDLLLVVEIGRLLLKRDNWSTEICQKYGHSKFRIALALLEAELLTFKVLTRSSL
jgi:hypothetical protein